VTIQREIELGVLASCKTNAATIRDVVSRLGDYAFRSTELQWVWREFCSIAGADETPSLTTLKSLAQTEGEDAQPILLEVVDEVWTAAPSASIATDCATLIDHHRRNELVKLMDRATKAIIRGDVDGAIRMLAHSAALPPSIGEAAAPTFPTISIGELIARAGSKPVEWDVEPLIARATGTSLSGLAGAGKTWLLLDLAIEMARGGGKWMNHFSCGGGRVVYVDEESRDPLLVLRLERLLRAKGVPTDQLDLRFIVMGGLNLSDPGNVARFTARLRELQPRLVIVDSFIRVHREKENDATEMAKVSRVIAKLIQDLGCSFLFADHQRKPNALGESDTRGSTEKAAIQDQVLLVRRTKDGALVVEHRKSRFAPEVEPFEVELEDQDREVPEKASTTVRWTGKTKDGDAEAQLADDGEVVIRVLSGSSEKMARVQIVALCKSLHVPEKRASAALKYLEAAGRVERLDEVIATGGKKHVYRVAPAASPLPLESDGAAASEPGRFVPPTTRRATGALNLERMRLERQRVRAVLEPARASV
jgi:hypothetical protein